MGLSRPRRSRQRRPGAVATRRPAPSQSDLMPVDRPRYVSVIGASRCGPEVAALGEELGELLAQRGVVVVCGGGTGVMEAVAKGVKKGGGVCIGILPEEDRSFAAPDLTYSICSGIGHARNLSVVASGDAVIALGGAWGTLSEIGLARTIGRPVILLGCWDVGPPIGRRARRRAAGGVAGRGRRARPMLLPRRKARVPAEQRQPSAACASHMSGSPAIVRAPTASTSHPQGGTMTQRGVNLAFVAAKLARPRVGQRTAPPADAHRLPAGDRPGDSRSSARQRGTVRRRPRPSSRPAGTQGGLVQARRPRSRPGRFSPRSRSPSSERCPRSANCSWSGCGRRPKYRSPSQR